MSSAAAAERIASTSASSVSGRLATRDWHAAVRADDRRQREAVDVVDLAGPERLSRLDDFVAGRENRDARPREDLDV